MAGLPEWAQRATEAAREQEAAAAAIPAQVPGRVLHMDGDLLCYWAGGKEGVSVDASRMNALSRIEKARVRAGAESVYLHMTSSGSTKGDRRIIATVKPYQGQRNSSRRPANWGYLREFFENYHGNACRVKLWATREADDGFGFASAQSGGDAAFHTGDKDMRMLPGWHLTWDTLELVRVPVGTYELWHNDKLYGHKWFWTQMLMGDTADNIPGLPKLLGRPVGEVRAGAILTKARSNQDAALVVYSSYELEYADQAADRFAEQAALLWMRTDAAADPCDFMSVLADADPVVVKAVSGACDRLKERIAHERREIEAIAAAAVSQAAS